MTLQQERTEEPAIELVHTSPLHSTQATMPSDPAVSVILTVFRRTDYLADAIRSVHGQSFSDWECIVTDDANSAAARKICAEFAHDSRIRYRANQTPLGTPINIATALGEARGRYVAILNDDDILYPEMLAHLAGPLNANPSVVMSFGNHHIVDSRGGVLLKETNELMEARSRSDLRPGRICDPFSFALRHGVMVVMGCLLRRSAINESWLVSEVAGAYDYWIAVHMARQGEFFFLPEFVMAWRQHVNSATSRICPSKFAAEVFIFESLAVTRLTPSNHEYVRGKLALYLFLRGIEHLQEGWSAKEARRLLVRSLRTQWRRHVIWHWLSSFLPRRARAYGIKSWRRICTLRDSLPKHE